MESALESILINTYNPDASLRQQAEQALNEFVATSGSLTALVNYIGNTNNHRELRQATGLVIKNKLRNYWTDPADCTSDESRALAVRFASAAPERDYVKERILQVLLVELDNSIRGILAEAVRIISEKEFPNNWSTLIPTILSCIESTDVLWMYNALLALRKVAKRYEYKQNEARQPLDGIVQASFPHLQQLMTNISAHQSLEAAQVMKMCLKIFWSATMYQLPKVQGVDVNFWFQAIAHIINKPLHEAAENIEPLGQPVDRDERPQWPWWKLKKWATRIASQFIQRYGNPRYATEENQQFAIYFRENTAAQLLAPAMNALAARAKGAYLTDEVQRMCISYVASCAEMSPTYKVMKPHLEFVVVSVIFPTLCLSDNDIQLFSEEPVEFVRKVHDPLGDWLSPLLAATNLLQVLARYRQNDTLPVVLPYIQNLLLEYSNAPPQQKDFRKKDGALVAIAVMAKILLESKQHKAMLVPFLQTHVIPEFQSPIPILRSRACWVIEYFSDIDWSQQQPQPLLQLVLGGLITCLRDPALPVQAAAACSLRLLIAADGATDLLRPLLHDIVTEYFRIMREVENESVLSALQAIVEGFGDDIAPLAHTMLQHLVALFEQYIKAGEDDEDATFNAVQCLDTIDAVLEAVCEVPGKLLELEIVTLPTMMRLLVGGNDLFEYIDSAVHMISTYTYYSLDKGISRTMWSLCGPLLHVLFDWAIDYICQMMAPILNYLTKDIATFVQGQYNGEGFVQKLLMIVDKAFSNDESEACRDSSAAATLLTCLVTSAQELQAVNDFLPQILVFVLQKLSQCKQLSLRIRLLEVVMACVYYNPLLSLSCLTTDAAVAQNLFTLLFDTLKEMERDFTQRLVVLSFTALLSVPKEQLPPILVNNLLSMFQQSIRELVMIEEEAAKKGEEGEEGGDDDGDEDDDDIDDDDDEEEEEEEGEGEEEDGEFDDSCAKQAKSNRAKALFVPEGGYGEDDDCLNAEDEAYRVALEQLDKDEEVRRQKYSGGELITGDEDEDEDDEDFLFTSPLENMDVAKHFLSMMNQLSHRDAALASSLQSSLEEQDKQRLQELVATVQQRAADT